MSTNIEGKVVVITGASSGLGESTARHLAGLGATVALGARRKDRLDAIVKDITAKSGKALAVTVDVTKREQVDALIPSAALISLAHGLESNGWLALRFLESVGVFPLPRQERPAPVPQKTPAEIKEEKLRAHFAKFAEETYERSRAFDAPLVAGEKDLNDAEAKSNGTGGRNERSGTDNDKPSPAARRSIFDSRDEG